MCRHSVIYSTPEVWDPHSALYQKADFITYLRKGELCLLGTVSSNKTADLIQHCWEAWNSSIGELSVSRSLVTGMGCRWQAEFQRRIHWREAVPHWLDVKGGGRHWLAGFQKQVCWCESSLIWANKFNPVLVVTVYHDCKAINLFLGVWKLWLANSECQ